MHRIMNLRAVFGLTLALALLGACNRGTPDVDKASGDDLMRFVPADTPYLFTTGTPLPDKVQDKLEPKIDEILRSYQLVFSEVFEGTLSSGNAKMAAEERQRVAAVVAELSSLLSIEGLRNAGFDRDSGLAAYGNGLLPVLRIEVSDTKLFDAAIGRIEEAAGESMNIAKLDDHTYRYIGDDKGSLIIASIDETAVFAMAPSVFDDDQKRQLLGLTKPENSIAATSTLQDIAAEYGFSGHYMGFVDARRIASTFLETPTGLDAPLLASIPHNAETISHVCKTEIRQFVDVAPRLVFGYNEIGTDAMSGSLIVEMRSDLAAGLSAVGAIVPGLGNDPGGVFSLGFGVNLLSLREFYEARLDAMEADPFECEYFADMQAGVAQGRAALNQPLPPVAYGLRGFMAVIDEVGDFDMTRQQPPKDLDASVLVALDDAQAIVAMGAMFSPELAALDLKTDGVPVLLDLPQLQAMGQTVYAAMLEDVVALSVGKNAEKRIKRVLTADSATPPPLFSMTMDAGRYYSLIAKSMMQEGDDKDGVQLSLAGREAMRDAMLVLGKMYDRMAVDIRFTQRGMELDSRVTLKD